MILCILKEKLLQFIVIKLGYSWFVLKNNFQCCLLILMKTKTVVTVMS